MKKSGVLFHSHIFFYDNNIGKKISFNIYYYFTHAGLGENRERAIIAATVL